MSNDKNFFVDGTNNIQISPTLLADLSALTMNPAPKLGKVFRDGTEEVLNSTNPESDYDEEEEFDPYSEEHSPYSLDDLDEFEEEGNE